ncbi:MAG: hypothetical protein LBU24_00165 [Methanocalculaceae archaeon]|jgi:hypothetical protein|nr:hypothetical protein [Methanocalculaceae archaeon]
MRGHLLFPERVFGFGELEIEGSCLACLFDTEVSGLFDALEVGDCVGERGGGNGCKEIFPYDGINFSTGEFGL